MSISPLEVAPAAAANQPQTGLGAPEAVARAIQGRSPFRLALARLRTDRAAWMALGMLVFVALLAICAPLISAATGHNPYNPNLDTGTNSFGQPYGPGQAGYLLGTDDLGRDILVRIVYGARISLLVGVLATAIATIVGTVLGLVSGYFAGWIDAVLARMMDTVLSFPYVLLAIVLAAVYGGSLPLTIVIIAFFSWAAIGRIVRGQTLSLKEKEFVEAAHAMGASNFRIMFIDILPNLVAPILVLGTLLVPVAIVFEATLDFLGVGVGPPTPTWGNMLADAEGRAGFGAWWFWLFPSAALLITTLGFNILGDSVRDALDPRTERVFATRRKKVAVVSALDVVGGGRHQPDDRGRGSTMTRFIIRRVAQGILTLWVIVSLVFVLFFMASPDPARLLAGRAATPGLVQQIRVALGLNHPLWQQYLNFIWRLLQGDLGTSYKLHEPVTSLIGQWVPIDISLAVGGGIIWLTLGLSVGILAARRPRSVLGPERHRVRPHRAVDPDLRPRPSPALHLLLHPHHPRHRHLSPGRELDPVPRQPSGVGA